MRDKDNKKRSKKAEIMTVIIGLLICGLLSALIIWVVKERNKYHHHSFTTTVLKEATCNEAGKASNKCNECGYEYEFDLARKSHSVGDNTERDGLIHDGKCINCGEDVQFMIDAEKGVEFSAPLKTRKKRISARVKNSRGYEYNYVMYLQGAEYDSYTRYMNLHGCSTCALTSLLNAIVPELKDYTPDRVVDEIEPIVFGEEAFKKNYKDDRENGSMPITLYGMTKIFDKYNVRYDLPTDNHEEEITNHLKNGDPVIVTFAKGGTGGLSNSIHTIILIGIDKDGYVIIGDSLHKKSKVWGGHGLIKPGKITVADMVSYIMTYDNWSVAADRYDSGGHPFYKNKSDRGYLLVYGD